MSEEKVPVGTRVRYHGSVHTPYREFIVQGYCDLADRHDLPDQIKAEHWPGGVSYLLWPVDVPVKYGNRDEAISYVRRQSFDVLDT